MAEDRKLARVNGRYYVKFRKGDGTWGRRSLGTSDVGVAKSAIAEFSRVADLARSGAPLTVGGLYDAYAGAKEAEGRPAAVRIRDAWKRLSPAFGNLLASQVNEEACLTYTADRRNAGASDGTIHVELGYLRAALRYAHRKKKWITEEPFVPLPRKPKPRDHHLTQAEARAMLDRCETDHIRLFIVIALSTAGRVSAILDLTWDRVDFARRKIVLSDPDRPDTPKGRATVPMNDMAHKFLTEAAEAALSRFVIEWGGDGVASVKKGLKGAARRTGLYCTPHVLRHTAAVWMAEAGVPMEEIAQYLGHSNVDTTRRIYARFSPEYLRRAASALVF